MDREKWRDRLKALRIPLLVLLLGIGLMLIPERGSEGDQTPEEKLEQVLRQSSGVGACRVLVSENGVLVVCEGAEDPGIQLQILRAVTAYTGFASDKITVLKMADHS